MRAAPLAEDVRPIRAGLEGGRYKPLVQADLERVHAAVLDLLERVGFANAIPSCIGALTRAGATLGDDGRLRFPRGLVEATIRDAARNFTLHGQDPRHDMLISGSRVHYGTAGAAVHVVDVEKREYRESLLQDIYDAARIVEVMENIHFFQRPMVPRDVPDPLAMDFNTLYACVSGTTKHVGTSFTVRENVAPALEMLYAIAGAVAPACPADSSRIGMPPSTQASSTPQASSANFIGGTTKQLEFDTNGRARKLSSPPAIA